MNCIRCGTELVNKCNACAGVSSSCFTENVACFGGRGYKCPLCSDSLNSIDETTGEFIVPEGGYV